MKDATSVVQFHQAELAVVVEALAAFPVQEARQGRPYLRALHTFRRAAGSQSFEATAENLEAALQALMLHTDRVPPERRDELKEFSAKLASYLLTPSATRTDPSVPDIFINRHPIYLSNLTVFAYELLTEKNRSRAQPPAILP